MHTHLITSPRTLIQRAVIALCALFLAALQAGAQSIPGEIAPKDALVIGPVARGGRTLLPIDPLAAQVAAGTWTPPAAGDTLSLPGGGTAQWAVSRIGQDGFFRSNALGGGYAYIAVTSDTRRVMILEASAHTMVYVNGEPRAGDPYEYGMTRLPVLLKKGRNDFLFVCGRGRLKMRLVPPKASAQINPADPTLPDLIQGDKNSVWGATVVLNTTEFPLSNLALTTSGKGMADQTTPLPTIPPLSTRKVPFRLSRTSALPGTQEVQLRLTSPTARAGTPLDAATLNLRVRRPQESQKRTFFSAIDGSLQYFGLLPAQSLAPTAPPPALFLSLHGASVEAIGLAEAYYPKTWGHLVAPTNRRPFGFDWEDWGRLDAMEVLELARKTLRVDPQRVYLTGHSMGGHGTWHLGATFPDKFAAIGPSAGWISFFTYAGGRRFENPNPIEAMLQRANAPSETLALARNYAQHGVYILHGGADDNVPADQARTMSKTLAEFHRDWDYHEQPGAGHWWSNSDEPGAACVDWPPMFDFFARRALPPVESVRQVEFTTMHPGVSAWCRWAGIEAQMKPMQPSTVRLRFDPGLRRFSGTTENVARLCLDIRHLRPGVAIQVELDGIKLPPQPWPAGGQRLWLQREGTQWKPIAAPSLSVKGPHRSGPFKLAYQNKMLLVYGTRGSAEENAWAFARARYDAETFWYRGNGAVDIVPDMAFDPTKEPNRNVILYGNADTNSAWQPLLATGPVQVRRGRAQVGEREWKGDSFGCLFVRPRPGSDMASVAVVTGSGLPGLRATDRLPVFVSGVGFPDFLLLTPEAFLQGSAGVRGAGFFGNDWSVASGEFAWSAPAPLPSAR